MRKIIQYPKLFFVLATTLLMSCMVGCSEENIQKSGAHGAGRVKFEIKIWNYSHARITPSPDCFVQPLRIGRSASLFSMPEAISL